MTDNTATPDSWETVADAGLNAGLSRLNVNAAVFVPNVNAPEFVPSFLKEPQAPGKALMSQPFQFCVNFLIIQFCTPCLPKFIDPTAVTFT